MTQYNALDLVNVDLTTVWAKSRGLRRLPDEVDFPDGLEVDLTPKESQVPVINSRQDSAPDKVSAQSCTDAFGAVSFVLA
jgi:hypothetical protein